MTEIVVSCSMCNGERRVPHTDDDNRLMKFIFKAGYHVIHIEPPLDDDQHHEGGHSHTLVCGGCARKIDGRKPS